MLEEAHVVRGRGRDDALPLALERQTLAGRELDLARSQWNHVAEEWVRERALGQGELLALPVHGGVREREVRPMVVGVHADPRDLAGEAER